jgi:hypothetical protein
MMTDPQSGRRNGQQTANRNDIRNTSTLVHMRSIFSHAAYLQAAVPCTMFILVLIDSLHSGTYGNHTGADPYGTVRARAVRELLLVLDQLVAEARDRQDQMDAYMNAIQRVTENFCNALLRRQRDVQRAQGNDRPRPADDFDLADGLHNRGNRGGRGRGRGRGGQGLPMVPYNAMIPYPGPPAGNGYGAPAG